MDDWPRCTIADHNEQKVNGFCFNPNCKSKQRLLCFNCLKETTHDEHKNDIMVWSKLPQWLSEQQQITQNFLQTLYICQENIKQPIQKIEKFVETSFQQLSDQDFVQLNYSELNEAIRSQVFIKSTIVEFCKSKIQQYFEMFSKIIEKLFETLTTQNITNSGFKKRLDQILKYLIFKNSPVVVVVNKQENNSTNQNNSNGTFLQTLSNLQDYNNNNQLRQGQLDRNKKYIDDLSQLYTQNSVQIDQKLDISIQDGIECLIQGEYVKAHCIFDMLQQQKSNHEALIWLAYTKQLQQKNIEVISTIKQNFANQKITNPQIWYITMMSVIGLQNYSDALYCVQKYLALRPFNLKGWVKAGYILLMQDQYELAIKYLLIVIKYEQNNIEAKSYLCMAYYSTDQNTKADKLYDEIKQIDLKSNFLNQIQSSKKK